MIVDSVGGCPLSEDAKIECSKLSTFAATCRVLRNNFTFVQSDWPY